VAANLWQSVARNKNWRIGRTAPNNAVGINGEFWLNDSTGDLYEKVNGVYVIVPVPSGGGGGAVDSVFGRTGHVVALSGDYNATQVGLGNVTNDAQLKRAAGDFSSFANKAAPVGSDVVLIEDSAAGGAKKHVLVSTLGGSSPPFDPADLNPFVRYNASAVATSGGFVDTMTDLGSAGKNMTASGTDRCAIGTDANGKLYFDFAANRIYRAGVATDWTWMHDNTKQYTVIVVMANKPGSLQISAGILATMDWSSTSRGMFVGRGNANGVGYAAGNGYDFGINLGDIAGAGGWNAYCTANRSHPPFSTSPEVVSFAFNRIIGDVNAGYGSNNMQWSGISMTAQRASVNAYSGKTQVAAAFTPAPPAPSALAPARALTFGAMGDNTVPLSANVYEVFITQQALSPYDIQRYAEWAATEYQFSLTDW
jgi:hypothetical protein